jgi:hypothetical protein
MKIDILSYKEKFEKSIEDKHNRDNSLYHFSIHKEQLNGETVYLTIPRANSIWSNETLIFRSSIWDKDGNLISASFKKFFNWEEQPNIDPKPYSLSGCQLIEKIDGATLIVSNFKDTLLTRTRQIIDFSFNKTEFYKNLDELTHFKKVYPNVFKIDSTCSYIYEWVSPKNQIILNYDVPDIYLIGIIRHSDYSMFSQDELDKHAQYLGVKRPKVFKFSTILEMMEAVKKFKGVEGICVYYNHGQQIRKVKATEYLMLHHFKSDLRLENVLDLYLMYDRPNYKDFIERITQEFDWECLQYIQGFASKVCDTSTEVNQIIDSMKKFADSVRNLSRKEAAEKILSSYGKTSRSDYVFGFLSNRQIDNKSLKKLYIQVLGHL